MARGSPFDSLFSCLYHLSSTRGQLVASVFNRHPIPKVGLIEHLCACLQYAERVFISQ